MAKRKRLEPARLDGAPGADNAPPMPDAPMIETKSPFPTYPPGISPGIPPARRSPIAEVAGDAATMAAIQELTQTLTSARNEGRLIQALPLAEIDQTYLVRDRIDVDPDEMATLRESLRLRGQQTAIEVADLGMGRSGGRWGLISGWRRLQALRQLQTQTAGTDTVLAIVRTPREAADAYLAMVEENEIRVGLSHYERARIVARATDQGVYAHDRAGLSALFATASRSKRSKIGSFLRIVRALDDHLRFPAALNERLGLALSAALEADPGMPAQLVDALAAAAPDSAVKELRIIQKMLRAAAPPARVPALADMTGHPGASGETALILDGDGRLILSGLVVADPRFQDMLRQWIRDYEASHRVV